MLDGMRLRGARPVPRRRSDDESNSKVSLILELGGRAEIGHIDLFAGMASVTNNTGRL